MTTTKTKTTYEYMGSILLYRAGFVKKSYSIVSSFIDKNSPVKHFSPHIHAKLYVDKVTSDITSNIVIIIKSGYMGSILLYRSQLSFSRDVSMLVGGIGE